GCLQLQKAARHSQGLRWPPSPRRLSRAGGEPAEWSPLAPSASRGDRPRTCGGDPFTGFCGILHFGAPLVKPEWSASERQGVHSGGGIPKLRAVKEVDMADPKKPDQGGE